MTVNLTSSDFGLLVGQNKQIEVSTLRNGTLLLFCVQFFKHFQNQTINQDNNQQINR